MKNCKKLKKINIQDHSKKLVDNLPGRKKKTNPALKALKLAGIVTGAGLGVILLGGVALITSLAITNEKFESQ